MLGRVPSRLQNMLMAKGISDCIPCSVEVALMPRLCGLFCLTGGMGPCLHYAKVAMVVHRGMRWW